MSRTSESARTPEGSAAPTPLPRAADDEDWAGIEGDIRAYERLRRQRADPVGRHSNRPLHVRKEPDYLLEFALRWLPHGGAPEDEMLVEFGMTKARFAEVLRVHLPRSTCDPDLARRLLRVYRRSDDGRAAPGEHGDSVLRNTAIPEQLPPRTEVSGPES